MSLQSFDVIVIGSGLAGLTAALLLANTHKVAVITKRELPDGSSGWAQGGMAAVLGEGDTLEQHVRDTLVAGAGLCNLDATRSVVEGAPAAISWLRSLGVEFSEDVDKPGSLHLTREGGHSQRRIVHAADATGAAVQRTLIAKVKATPAITVFEHHMLIDVITDKHLKRTGKCCHGAYVLDVTGGEVITFAAQHTILATGGAGKVYLYSTNPDTATGDGIAAAWRAGCSVANMEFIQFHPTCLYHPEKRSFLITEAMRGEGARLIGADGKDFMQNYDKRGTLAPRDIVARAIDHEIKRTGGPCVYLDISHKPADFILSHFPNIHKACLEVDIDITKQPIPVVPAAHYQCGGVVTDVNGATRIRGLCAVGEVGCTGLHGANRLASNSLLECLVISHRAVEHMLRKMPIGKESEQVYTVPPWQSGVAVDNDELVVIYHNWDEIRRLMWDYVSIVRTGKRLQRAAARLRNLKREVQEFYWNFRITSELLELRNLVETASLIVECAIRRHESRGLHYTLDFPDKDEARTPVDTTLRRY